MKRKREERGYPAHIGPVVEEVLSKAGLDRLVQASRVFKLWDNAVGPTIARHAQPRYFRRGMLIVHVDSSVWLTQLDRYLKDQIQENLNRIVQKPRVEKIVFRIGELDQEPE